MATVTGARGTTLISSDQRVVNMADAIKLYTPDATPFTTLLMQLRKSATVDPLFSSLEDDVRPRFDAVNNGAGYSTTATSIVVDNGAYFAQHDVVRNTRTGEIIRVSSVSTNTLTVVRAADGDQTTGIAMNDNDELAILGSAQPEGDTSKPARSQNPTKISGYTQIFKSAWHLTNTAIASNNQTTPHDWDLQATKTGIEHKRSINRSLLYNGNAKEDTSGSQPRRYTKGLISAITTNVTDAGGTLTETEFNAFMRQVFGVGTGSKRKLLLASPLVTSVLNTFGAGKIQITNQNESSYGVNFTTFTGPFGALRLATDWELAGSKFGGYGVVIDLDNVDYKYLANARLNRDSHIETNIQGVDEDARKDQWLTECGLNVSLERSHGLLVGVTG